LLLLDLYVPLLIGSTAVLLSFVIHHVYPQTIRGAHAAMICSGPASADARADICRYNTYWGKTWFFVAFWRRDALLLQLYSL